MRVIKTKSELKSYLSSLDDIRSLGLVPTMGALHPGHLSLVERSVSENQSTLVSIFVNPTQFDNTTDLVKYPKNLTADIDILNDISDKITVFAPSVAEIYPEGAISQSYDFGGLDKVMEGTFREGHFYGVGTVVETLLRLIAPSKAYFGEKDFQQLQIIRKLAEIKDIPVEIIGCPIIRESNGLAMSSRNQRLTKNQREEAGLIYRVLKTAKHKFGTESAHSIENWVKAQFDRNNFLRLEYIHIVEEETLVPITRKESGKKYRAFIAVYVEDVRLIDNIALN